MKHYNKDRDSTMDLVEWVDKGDRGHYLDDTFETEQDRRALIEARNHVKLLERIEKARAERFVPFEPGVRLGTIDPVARRLRLLGGRYPGAS